MLRLTETAVELTAEITAIERLIELKDLAAAAERTRRLWRDLPKISPAHTDTIARLLHQSKAYQDAVEPALCSLKLLPNSPTALFNAAKCVLKAGDPANSVRFLGEVLRIRPLWIDASLDLGVSLTYCGRFEEAATLLRKLLSEIPAGDPSYRLVRFNLAWHEIREGHFQSGLAGLRIGRKIGVWGSEARQINSLPLLLPETDLRGKRILICGEGGAGDEIIGARFTKTIAERGGEPSWLSHQKLASLFSRSPGIHQGLDTPPLTGTSEFDYWAPCMDLPWILKTELHELPRESYLAPLPSFTEKWKSRLSAPAGELRIGLRWAGNALYETDIMRSFPFQTFEPLLQARKATFFSLQKDEAARERPRDSTVIDLGPELESWEDTAAVISQLDLVISSCTSVAHLAAALGKPTWVITPLVCYYPWASPGHLSPWYSSVRLFRQTTYGCWQAPAEEAARSLSNWTPPPTPER